MDHEKDITELGQITSFVDACLVLSLMLPSQAIAHGKNVYLKDSEGRFHQYVRPPDRPPPLSRVALAIVMFPNQPTPPPAPVEE